MLFLLWAGNGESLWSTHDSYSIIQKLHPLSIKVVDECQALGH